MNGDFRDAAYRAERYAGARPGAIICQIQHLTDGPPGRTDLSTVSHRKLLRVVAPAFSQSERRKRSPAGPSLSRWELAPDAAPGGPAYVPGVTSSRTPGLVGRKGRLHAWAATRGPAP